MNPAAALSLVAAVVGVVVAMLSARLGRAPGWGPYKSLGLIALTAAAYTATDCFATLPISDHAVRLIVRGQGVFAAIHVACWLHYVRSQLVDLARPSDRWLRSVLLGCALVSLVPGLALTEVVWSFEVPWLGVIYRGSETTPLGTAIYGFECVVLGVVMSRYVRAARNGVVHASVNAIAIFAILATAVHDTLVGSQLLKSPLLLSAGFLVSVGAMGVVLTRAFVDSARELDNFSHRLEDLVTARTDALVETELALLSAEKMAALGRLAAGVAHEINNPAAAVYANVEYLRDASREGNLPADAVECLEESLESIARIARIVRQLLDLGRAAVDLRSEIRSASVAHAVHQALADSRGRLGPHIVSEVEVSPDLHVQADPSSLVQVLVNLVVNAAQASDGPATVRVRAAEASGAVLVEVIDEGHGMSSETQRRLFEPFYTTKSFGQGTGLGLSVSRGIIQSMGGELYVGETRPGRTVMCLRLTPGTAVTSSAKPREAPPVVRRSLLLLDDDPHVGRGLVRALGASFDVELATSVDHATARIGERAFDVMLADLRMPDGGGARLVVELAQRSMDVVPRVVLFSGGEPSEADRLVIDRYAVPFLAKPLVVDDLLDVLQRSPPRFS